MTNCRGCFPGCLQQHAADKTKHKNKRSQHFPCTSLSVARFLQLDRLKFALKTVIDQNNAKVLELRAKWTASMARKAAAEASAKTEAVADHRGCGRGGDLAGAVGGGEQEEDDEDEDDEYSIDNADR